VPVLPRIATALNYPTRPVHIVVGFPAGLGPDVTARLIAQQLSERSGQSFVVENRPGAGSNIATEAVVKSPSDGYTLILMTATNAINSTLYRNLTFDFVRDIAPVASVGTVPFLMLVNPSMPTKTVREFIAYAKARPGQINMGSAGIGTAPHVFGELFMMMTGVKLVHVPYNESYYPDLLAGRLQIAFAPVITAVGFTRSCKLRALAVTSKTRLEALCQPDRPTCPVRVNRTNPAGH
jgi:tripartite-type tricarboxylate transporter receptor subunit TctC